MNYLDQEIVFHSDLENPEEVDGPPHNPEEVDAPPHNPDPVPEHVDAVDVDDEIGDGDAGMFEFNIYLFVFISFVLKTNILVFTFREAFITESFIIITCFFLNILLPNTFRI